ncbi:hypothetical protein, partial [uncultured Victivallis sp.]|uniref:hypothetical protein n=1 Tax=uncultured Victivallis sp. TaxID=354118 RepID=UPI0025898EA6
HPLSFWGNIAYLFNITLFKRRYTRYIIFSNGEKISLNDFPLWYQIGSGILTLVIFLVVFTFLIYIIQQISRKYFGKQIMAEWISGNAQLTPEQAKFQVSQCNRDCNKRRFQEQKTMIKKKIFPAPDGKEKL